MKVKYGFSAILSLMILFSVFQTFSVPPYAGDIYTLYKSGYFRELDRGFSVILESFMGIKTLGRPVFAWIFLQDIEKNQGITVSLYDRFGRKVTAPGLYGSDRDAEIRGIIESVNPEIKGGVSGGRYRAIIPLKCENKCRICHNECAENSYFGAMAFERDYDAEIYYSSERVIIFSVLTVLLSGLLFFVLRWDPGRNVKELFDKK